MKVHVDKHINGKDPCPVGDNNKCFNVAEHVKGKCHISMESGYLRYGGIDPKDGRHYWNCNICNSPPKGKDSFKSHNGKKNGYHQLKITNTTANELVNNARKRFIDDKENKRKKNKNKRKWFEDSENGDSSDSSDNSSSEIDDIDVTFKNTNYNCACGNVFIMDKLCNINSKCKKVTCNGKHCSLKLNRNDTVYYCHCGKNLCKKCVINVVKKNNSKMKNKNKSKNESNNSKNKSIKTGKTGKDEIDDDQSNSSSSENEYSSLGCSSDGNSNSDNQNEENDGLSPTFVLKNKKNFQIDDKKNEKVDKNSYSGHCGVKTNNFEDGSDCNMTESRIKRRRIYCNNNNNNNSHKNKFGNLSEEEMTQYKNNNVGYDASNFEVDNYSLQLDSENNDSNNEYSNNDSNGNLYFVSCKIMDNKIDNNLHINSNDNLTNINKNNILRVAVYVLH